MKKTAAAEISAAVPWRLMGAFLTTLRSPGFASSGYRSSPVVAMKPGITQLTRTPAAAHSTAEVMVRFASPARAAPL